MFFHLTLERTLHLEPKYLGPNIRNILISKLHSEAEGTCSGRYGFLIIVTNVDHIGLGKVQDGTGLVTFPIKFKAIVFKPFKNEILDAVVSQVNKIGFFAEVGPLQVFVSKHLIPNEFTFDAQSPTPCYVSEDGNSRIAPESEVRLKVVGTRIDATEIFAIGSIKEDFLGVMS
eukprot:TRINITY_DN5347_c0_g1_i1.p1 TRINITY_DN5347_c0_g1~~TRINITY_DN5347_c0_g1_i1.p1  ORF type:complete len:173 (-),score=27.98 TRINITY_DN5347_c0_g1_i1:64-582(-)